MAIRKEALFPDFTSFVPQDGSVETVQDYQYYADHDIRVVPSGIITRLVLKIERFIIVPDDATEDERRYLESLTPPALQLFSGNMIRIECADDKGCEKWGYRAIRRVTMGAPGSGSGIVTLESALNFDPVPGTQVKRIKALSQHYIDSRLYDQVEKGKLQIYGGKYYTEKAARGLNLPLF